jgi:hypothetical protein
VDTRASLDAVEKKKSLASAGNRTMAVQPVAVPTELTRAIKGQLRETTMSRVSGKYVGHMGGKCGNLCL